MNFSTGYLSSTDSFGESTEANSRNAHNFSNSQICALPITIQGVLGNIWKAQWAPSARQIAQLLKSVQGKGDQCVCTRVEGGPGVPSGSLLTQLLPLRSPCLRGGTIQDAIKPWPQAVTFSRGAVGRKYKCRNLGSNTEPSTSSSDLFPKEEAREANPDKWQIVPPLSWFMHKAKRELFSCGGKKKNLYNIFCSRKDKIPGKGFLLSTRGVVLSSLRMARLGRRKALNYTGAKMKRTDGSKLVRRNAWKRQEQNRRQK